MNETKAIKEALNNIFKGIESLKDAFPSRAFTIDGRLVGDLGEIIASLNYDVILHAVQQSDHDGESSDGKKVQIKATFKDSLTFRTIPDYYLGLKLFPDGQYEEIYNGPGRLIYEHYKHRKGIGEVLLSFPLSELQKLSGSVPPSNRIRKL